MVLYRQTARHECLGHTRVSTGFRLYQVINNLVHTRGIDICWTHQVINVLFPLSGHQQFFVYIRSSTILRLYQVISDSLFIPGRSELFTPVAAVWGALLWPMHSRGAIPGPFACVAPGRTRSTPMGRFWAACFFQLSSLRDVQNSGRPFRTAQGSSFRLGSVYFQPHVRTSGTGQQVDQTWPGASSDPRFSYGISQTIL